MSVMLIFVFSGLAVAQLL
jgi:hypothetical protein